MDRVKAESPNLQAAKARVEATEGQLSGVHSAWRPSIWLDGALTYTAPNQVMNMTGMARGIAAAIGQDPSQVRELPDVQMSPNWYAQATLHVRQLLFDPSAWYGSNTAREAVVAAKLGAESAVDQMQFAAAQLYAGIQALGAIEAAAQRAVGVSQKRIQEAEVRVKAGLSAPIDITRAQVGLAERETALASVATERKAMLAELQALIGSDQPLEVSKDPIPDDFGQAGQGLMDRSDVKASQAAVVAATEDNHRTSRLWMPTVFIEGQAKAATKAGFSDDHLFFTGILGLSLPIYDGCKRCAEDDVSAARLAEAEARHRSTVAAAQAEIDKGKAKLASAEIQLKLAQSQVTLSEQAVSQVTELRDNGLATSLDLEDADARRFGAERQLVQKNLDVTLSRLRLHYAQGGKL